MNRTGGDMLAPGRFRWKSDLLDRPWIKTMMVDVSILFVTAKREIKFRLLVLPVGARLASAVR